MKGKPRLKIDMLKVVSFFPCWVLREEWDIASPKIIWCLVSTANALELLVGWAWICGLWHQFVNKPYIPCVVAYKWQTAKRLGTGKVRLRSGAWPYPVIAREHFHSVLRKRNKIHSVKVKTRLIKFFIIFSRSKFI